MTAVQELAEALRALRIAENHFREAEGPYVLVAIYEMQAAIERYNAALARAKAEKSADITNSEGGTQAWKV